jgi:hypothetical protein
LTVVTVLADTPQWVEDGKNYFGLAASFVGALGLVFKYAVKPFFVHLEQERRREIDTAIRPLQEAVDRIAAKSVHLGDALSGVNLQIAELQKQQNALHQDVRAHMDAEDAAKKDGH